MTETKKLARTVGTLYIVGTAAGILSAVFAGPNLNQGGLNELLENEGPLVVGSLLVLLMGFSLAMIPVVLFPLLRKVSEILALGAVLFRGALEAVAYVAVAFTWLGLVTIGRASAGAGVEQTASLLSMRTVLLGAEEWTTLVLAIVFCLGALMIYWAFFVSRLVPRWLSAWGLVGAVLYLSVPFLGLVGLDGFGALMAPLAVQEMVLAVWLIVKGFDVDVTGRLLRYQP
ncbi:MAG: DUF4386 domain-containing protein [Trueperaceae bacterium]